MGMATPGANDNARVLSGTFTGTTSGGSYLVSGSRFNLSIWGTFVATVVLERSFDGGNTWINCALDGSGTQNSLTAPASLTCEEVEQNVNYRLRCSAFTSGTVNWRLSQ